MLAVLYVAWPSLVHVYMYTVCLNIGTTVHNIDPFPFVGLCESDLKWARLTYMYIDIHSNQKHQHSV